MLTGVVCSDDLLRHLAKVEQMLNMEDLGPAQEFIAKGGLDMLGMLCTQNLDGVRIALRGVLASANLSVVSPGCSQSHCPQLPASSAEDGVAGTSVHA